MSTTPSSSNPSKTFKQILKEAKAESDIELSEDGTLVEDTIHTLKFYCLERGSGVSLCSMKFNINIVSKYTDVEGIKEWKYADNPDLEPDKTEKPEQIKINLYRKMIGESGEEIIEGPLNSQVISENADGKWEYKFHTDSDGHRLTTEATIPTAAGGKLVQCTYYVEEEYLEGDEIYYDKYATEYVVDPKSTDYNKIINITNWYNYTNVTVKKEWDDNNTYDKRPSELKVTLIAKEYKESKIADEIINNKSWNLKKSNNTATYEDSNNCATTKNLIYFPKGTSFTFKKSDIYTFRYFIIDKIENNIPHSEYESDWKVSTKEQDFTAIVESDKHIVFSFKKYDGTPLTKDDIEEIKKLIVYTDPNCKVITNDIFNDEQIEQLTQHLTASENENDNWSYTWNELPRCIINEDKSITKINYDVEEELKTEDNYYQLDKIKVETTEKFYNITIINSMFRDIQVTKIDDKDESIKIGGAEFKLEKLKLNEKGEWVVDETVYRTTSNDSSNLGEGLFERLGPGKYILSETKAPPGYNKSKEKITIDIVALESDNIIKVNFKNKKGFVLPFTGGNTTLSYTIIGIAIMIAALDFMRPVLLLNRKNKRKPKRRKK